MENLGLKLAPYIFWPVGFISFTMTSTVDRPGLQELKTQPNKLDSKYLFPPTKSYLKKTICILLRNIFLVAHKDKAVETKLIFRSS